MSDTVPLKRSDGKPLRPRLNPVAQLRLLIIIAVCAAWEASSASGLVFRDVMPSLLVVGKALWSTLGDQTFYFHLGTTFSEIGAAMLVGGLAGASVGMLLGSSRFLSLAYEGYLYYLGPCPKIIFFPIMIMWFGVGSGSKVAIGAVSCFFPIAISMAAGMREVDKTLIRVGRSFRAKSWQLVTKIYLPAMRRPAVNSVRLGFGVALIGTLMAETKLSDRGIGFLVIKAYNIFDIPQMYALLVILFVISVGANALITRGGSPGHTYQP